MGGISHGAEHAIRTQSWSPSSCSSRRRSSLSYLIIMSGCAGFPISYHWRAPRKMKCFTHGKASATTLAREIFTLQRRRSWIDIADTSRAQLMKCRSFPASANTPRTPFPALPSINRSPSLKRILVAFWRDFSISKYQSIPAWAAKHYGSMRQVFSQNPMQPLSTPALSILARSFAWLASRNAICARFKHFAAQKIRLHCLQGIRDLKRNGLSNCMH